MTTLDGPVTPAGSRLCREQCSTCIFRPGNPMRLQAGRVRGMVESAIRADSFVVCHKTLDGERAICRGFFDAYGDRTLGCRLGEALGFLLVDADG